MASDREHSHDRLVERLTNGFGALLVQTQELINKNQDLEQRLARVREEVNPPLWRTSKCYDEAI